jgi:hypothetical protein
MRLSVARRLTPTSTPTANDVGGGALMDELIWPFPFAKPEAEWNEFDRDYINLMRAAYAEGYCPREGGCIDLGHWPEGRSVGLVRRGSRNGWEPYLCDSDRRLTLGLRYGLDENACVCVRPPFRAAAHLALEWMRGRSLDSLLGDFEFVGGSPPGIVLRPEVLPALVPRSQAADPNTLRYLPKE